MAKAPKKLYDPISSYSDRTKVEDDSFSELSVTMTSVHTTLLLLDSLEEQVLIAVLNHLAAFARNNETNVIELKEHHVVDLLVTKGFYIDAESILIKRFALYLVTAIFQQSELQEFESVKTSEILDACFRMFNQESDDFCVEYMMYIINMCLRDPQMAHRVLEDEEFMNKFKKVLNVTDNPDTTFNGIEATQKFLQVMNAEELLEFTIQPDFYIDRILCELTSDFTEIRKAALKVSKTLLSDTSEESVFGPQHRCVFVLNQLTKAFCEEPTNPQSLKIIDVLATALRSEKMTKLFFEQSLFDRIFRVIGSNIESYPPELRCGIIAIFAEAAKYAQFLERMHVAGITRLFISCVFEKNPATYVIVGLNRIIGHHEAQRRIVDAFELGLLARLVGIIQYRTAHIKTREQAAELIGRLLVGAFIETSTHLIGLNIAQVLGETLQQGLALLSIDLILSLLVIIETMAQNDEYREALGRSRILTEKIAQLLMRSYAHSILVNNIFRCLCTLIDEQLVREVLLKNFMVSSIKRALKSLSNLVKTSVTNFILQTTRFNEFVEVYIDRGILEVLMMHQKHAFCVSTWGPAIESILAKCPTMKFCIRHCLGFTDITAGMDFYISKHKFEDFRDFQNILINDCSPLDAVLVVNFDRAEVAKDDVMVVPSGLLQANELVGEDRWCYCKRPSDPFLPKYLEDLNNTLSSYGLVENPEKIRRGIDFDNVAKRAKIIAAAVASVLNENLKILDLNTTEECARHTVNCHLLELRYQFHTNFIPIGVIRSGCQFERAVLFKCFADQIGLPSTLQRSVDGRMLYNEVPLPLEIEKDIHCDKKTLHFMPWRMLRPTHIVDLMYNVGELYPMQSRQALQYLRLY